jgi:hypothetical protein
LITGGKRAPNKGYYAIVATPPKPPEKFKAEIVFDSVWFLKLTSSGVTVDERADVLVRDETESNDALLVIQFK